MVVYDYAYREIRKRYLAPLTRYNINFRSLKNNNIKTILPNFKSVQKHNNDYYLYYNDDVLLKGLLGDIELFFIKALLQKNDALICNSLDLSANWNIVTYYYYSFFYASLFLRFCFRGNIFLEDKLRKRIDFLIKTILGEGCVPLDSNMFYTVELKDNEYVLRLSKSESNTHEVVWKKLNDLLSEIKMYSKERTDENTIINNILNINSKIGVTYPSKLRNKVNYQPVFGIESINKNIHNVSQIENWGQYFLMPSKGLSAGGSIDSHSNAMYSYAMYIDSFCNNLMCEYYEIQGKENGILKNINKHREKKIVLPELRMSF